MEAEFWSASELDKMYHNGETVFIYKPPYRDMPRDFVAREHANFDALSAQMNKTYGADRVKKHVYISYNTYADLAVRLLDLFHKSKRCVIPTGERRQSRAVEESFCAPQ